MANTINWTSEMEELFPVVKASELSLNDSFLQHEPETDRQKKLKALITRVISTGGLRDFRKPIIDPSEGSCGEIFFKFGNLPAEGHDGYWWDKKAKEFMPAKNSRLGTKKEYAAFMAVIIKTLVEEEGLELRDAWAVVSEDSKYLGHYSDSVLSLFGPEYTGIKLRKVGKWYDLANMHKYIKTGAYTFAVASGCWLCSGENVPVAHIEELALAKTKCGNAVGWVIMDV